jgi:hypothetical protein
MQGNRGPGVYLCWAVGFQEPAKLLQSQENQVFWQQEFWGLLAIMGFQDPCSIVLQTWGNQACWIVPSVPHGSGTLGPSYAVMQVSLVFQGVG